MMINKCLGTIDTIKHIQNIEIEIVLGNNTLTLESKKLLLLKVTSDNRCYEAGAFVIIRN